MKLFTPQIFYTFFRILNRFWAARSEIVKTEQRIFYHLSTQEMKEDGYWIPITRVTDQFTGRPQAITKSGI